MANRTLKRNLKKSLKNSPLNVETNPISNVRSAKVSPEIIEEPAEISPSKQRQLDALKPYKWKEGQSGNPSGRSPDIVKGIALRVAQLKMGKILSPEELEKLKRLGLDTADITVIENIILDWATSTNPIKQQMYIERIAGKVPNVNINAEVSAQLVTKFRSKFTDAELQRIASGEDALELLLEKLPDVDGSVPTVIDIEDEQ